MLLRTGLNYNGCELMEVMHSLRFKTISDFLGRNFLIGLSHEDQKRRARINFDTIHFSWNNDDWILLTFFSNYIQWSNYASLLYAQDNYRCLNY